MCYLLGTLYDTCPLSGMETVKTVTDLHSLQTKPPRKLAENGEEKNSNN